MSFNPASPGTGVEHSVLANVVIANSTTINVGELVKTNSTGFLTNGAAAGPSLGIVVGFKTSSDTPIPPTAYAAGSATGTDVTQVVAASNNQTVAQQMAIVDISPWKRWSAQVNGTIGTNNASGKIGALIDVDSTDSNYDRVLESTSTRTTTTITNFYVWGTDPLDSTRLIVSMRSVEYLTKAG